MRIGKGQRQTEQGERRDRDALRPAPPLPLLSLVVSGINRCVILSGSVRVLALRGQFGIRAASPARCGILLRLYSALSLLVGDLLVLAVR